MPGKVPGSYCSRSAYIALIAEKKQHQGERAAIPQAVCHHAGHNALGAFDDKAEQKAQSKQWQKSASI